MTWSTVNYYYYYLSTICIRETTDSHGDWNFSNFPNFSNFQEKLSSWLEMKKRVPCKILYTKHLDTIRCKFILRFILTHDPKDFFEVFNFSSREVLRAQSFDRDNRRFLNENCMKEKTFLATVQNKCIVRCTRDCRENKYRVSATECTEISNFCDY